MKKIHSYKLTDILLSLIMIAVAVFAIMSGIRFGIIADGRPGTGFQPVFAGTILGISSICLLIRTLSDGRKHYEKIQADPELYEKEEQAHLAKEKEGAEYRRDTETAFGRFLEKLIPNAKIRWALIYFVGIWIIILMVDKLGMYFAIWFLNFVFLKFISKMSWVKSIIYSVAIAIAFYVVFALILDMTTPKFLNYFR